MIILGKYNPFNIEYTFLSTISISTIIISIIISGLIGILFYFYFKKLADSTFRPYAKNLSITSIVLSFILSVLMANFYVNVNLNSDISVVKKYSEVDTFEIEPLGINDTSTRFYFKYNGYIYNTDKDIVKIGDENSVKLKVYKVKKYKEFTESDFKKGSLVYKNKNVKINNNNDLDKAIDDFNSDIRQSSFMEPDSDGNKIEILIKDKSKLDVIYEGFNNDQEIKKFLD